MSSAEESGGDEGDDEAEVGKGERGGDDAEEEEVRKSEQARCKGLSCILHLVSGVI